MPRKGYKPTTSVFELSEKFHASDQAATVVGKLNMGVSSLAYIHCAFPPDDAATVYVTSGNDSST
jgi:hypothetical protein